MKLKKFITTNILLLSAIGLTACSQTQSTKSAEDTSTLSTEVVQKEKQATLELESNSFISDNKGNIVIIGKTRKNADITTTYSHNKAKADSTGVFKLTIPLGTLTEPAKTELVVASDLGKITRTIELIPSEGFIAAKKAEKEKIAAETSAKAAEEEKKTDEEARIKAEQEKQQAEINKKTEAARLAVEKAETSKNRADYTVAENSITAIPGGNSELSNRLAAVNQSIIDQEAALAAQKASEEQAASANSAAAQTPPHSSESQSVPVAQGQVYVAPDTGKKYHFDPHCRGLSNANEIVPMTLEQAQASGYTLCGWED